MAKMHKLTKGGQTIFPATIYDAVVNPKTRKSLTAELSELSILIDSKQQSSDLYQPSLIAPSGAFVSAITSTGAIGGGASNGKREVYMNLVAGTKLNIRINQTVSDSNFLLYAFYNSSTLSPETLVKKGKVWTAGSNDLYDTVPDGATVLCVSGKNEENVTFSVYSLIDRYIDNKKFNESIEDIDARLDTLSRDSSIISDITINKVGKWIDVSGDIGNTASLDITTSSSYTYLIVDCQGNDQFIINGSSSKPAMTWCFLSSDNEILNSGLNPQELTITSPPNSAKLIVNFLINKPYSLRRISSLKEEVDLLKERVSDNLVGGVICGNSDIGALDFETFDIETNYSIIIAYGQSLSIGMLQPNTGGSKYEEDAVEGCYMLGNDMQKTSGELQLMSNRKSSLPYNPSLLTCCSTLKILLDRTYLKGINLIGITPGVGDTSIEDLSDENGVGYTRFKTQLKAIKEKAVKVNCVAIIWMQGEANPNNTVTDYKTKLIELKNKMQRDIITELSQQSRPLFFTYQTGRGFSAKQAQAQFEFSEENEDVILLNPVYALPGPAHPSANGYRWYGELCAFQIYNTLVKGKRTTSVYPKKIRKKNNIIYIDCIVPVPPLQINTWTLPEKENYGFISDGQYSIVKISIINGVTIAIETDTDLIDKNVAISYGVGGVGKGVGNICDSNEAIARTKYISDYNLGVTSGQIPTDSKGEALTGKTYPMYNWLNQFYKLVE